MMYHLIMYMPFFLIMKTTSHVPKNDSNVVIYGGHADAADYAPPRRAMATTTTVKPVVTQRVLQPTTHIVQHVEDFGDKVVFVPTLAYDVKTVDDEFLHDDTMHLDEIVHGKNKYKLKDLTEKPATEHSDVVFVQGRNAERTQEEEVRKAQDRHEDARTKPEAPIKIDCKNLDCTHTVNSICGYKVENGHMRYRLFMNECFYRKVNCAFSYEANRYKVVPLEKCKKVGGHYTERNSFVYQPVPHSMQRQQYNELTGSETRHGLGVRDENKMIETRRRFSGRKAMMINTDGKYCSHACPTTCTDDYQPECAMSVSFERRVFLNHCQLDYNSCIHGIIWRRRPLAECVGGKKADMQQNRAFIDWMQRVGIVDKKGRLVLN